MSTVDVSPIGPGDQALFRAFFHAERGSETYGNSWTYITQACRGLGCGFKYFDGGTLVSIGLYRGHYVLVRPVGDAVVPVVRNLVAWLAERSGRPVYTKHAALADAGSLLAARGFRSDDALPLGGRGAPGRRLVS
ncbi:hypothetical protein [Streptomyces sp. BA2]|uniref:hypothetical protein n=1 Tax=Streptomyces sp. BA2 TaxID=436595 RepID=UPI0013207D14|nr:hypothetical protein [Streptomyces sp. BA2]MWA16004.1 hypothetical protein [Streptomyces sp. BA2]